MSSSSRKEAEKGLLCSLLMGFSFGLMGYLVNICHLPPPDLVFLRSGISCFILTPLIYTHLRELFLPHATTLLLRSLAGAAAMLCFFSNLQQAGVGIATSFANFAPIIVTLIAALFFKVKLKRAELIGITIAVAGALSLYKVSTTTASVAAVGLFGALCTAVAQLALRQAALSFSPALVVWSMSLVTMITSMLVGGRPSNEWWTSSTTLWAALGVALTGLLGQVFMTLAYTKLSAPVASTFGLSSLVWGVLFETAFSKNPPSFAECLSYLAIILGVCTIHLSQKNRSF
ncbi:MAG: DMT family transporter [Acidobacteriota bacterium]|nr:DMT family transporter [Blastocatellia bacterium]MDW8413465.1 DMT family transporter [Acidobacteriota bacterium]